MSDLYERNIEKKCIFRSKITRGPEGGTIYKIGTRPDKWRNRD